jgi:hypothetical protein
MLWALAPANPLAQTGDTPPSVQAHHVTVSGGLVWTGGYAIGDATATLRGNAVGPTAPPFTLFRAESAVDGSAGVDGRVGFAITRTLTVEGGVSYQQPGITTELSDDAEVPAATLDAERLSQYIVDVGVLWEVPRPVAPRRGGVRGRRPGDAGAPRRRLRGILMGGDPRDPRA